MKLQHIAAAVALATAGVAHAALEQFNGGSTAFGNGSVVLIMADTTVGDTGVVQGLTVDLGLHYSDFVSGSGTTATVNPLYSQVGTKIEWDFAANTITINGSILGGVTNDWAGQFASFRGASDAAETKWAIASGSQKGTTVAGFLATGTPDATQLAAQNTTTIANMAAVSDPLLKNAATKGTFASATNGAYAMGSTDTAWVGTAYSGTDKPGWKNNIKWNTWNTDGDSTNLTFIRANGAKFAVGDSSTYAPAPVGYELNTSNTLNGMGTFTLAGDKLVWQTATYTPAVPEPESFALALVGLAAAGFVARRRSAK